MARTPPAVSRLIAAVEPGAAAFRPPVPDVLAMSVNRRVDITGVHSGDDVIRAVISGLDQPMNIEFARDGRIFGVEKAGRIKVSTPLPTPRRRFSPAGDVMTGTKTVLVHDWCQQFASHSVGDLHFGADGMLYVSAGDGASYGVTDWGQFGSPVNPCADPPGGAMTAPGAQPSPPGPAGTCGCAPCARSPVSRGSVAELRVAAQ